MQHNDVRVDSSVFGHPSLLHHLLWSILSLFHLGGILPHLPSQLKSLPLIPNNNSIPIPFPNSIPFLCCSLPLVAIPKNTDFSRFPIYIPYPANNLELPSRTRSTFPSTHGTKLYTTSRLFPLTWVCYSWRNILLSQPTFWSSHFIKFSAHTTVYSPTAPALKECLLHAGTLPLDLTVYVKDNPSDVDDAAWTRSVDAITSYASRWKSLAFKLDGNAYLSYFLKRMSILGLEFEQEENPGHGLPFLETVDISFEHYSPAYTGSIPWNYGYFQNKIFVNCPRLLHLMTPYLLANDTIELRNLTCLEIGTYIGLSFADLLQRCPLLQTLIITTFRRSRDKSTLPLRSASEPFLHSHLSTLKIVYMDEEFVALTGVWQSVLLPKLTYLLLGIGTPYGDAYPFFSTSSSGSNAVDELKTMLIHSNCVLRDVLLLGVHSYDVLASFLLQGIYIDSETDILYDDDL
ncbi:hypothetical protein BT96DRAFT_988269 [Gymnopus androsaceus JB14]|uniref:F-box domain-containing protein n=1 Tax=Gymnopus androsaceus JB14 TaxID=1447944 RepID=A0A6A4I1X3_9AGAR|nr:hypothetical protein BT96DRAFT_988269 [Gymnopus androsaceus JB14]